LAHGYNLTSSIGSPGGKINSSPTKRAKKETGVRNGNVGAIRAFLWGHSPQQWIKEGKGGVDLHGGAREAMDLGTPVWVLQWGPGMTASTGGGLGTI